MTIAEVKIKQLVQLECIKIFRISKPRAKAVGLDPSKDKYTPENQIKIAEYLIGKGRKCYTTNA